MDFKTNTFTKVCRCRMCFSNIPFTLTPVLLLFSEWFKSKGWLSVGWTWIIDCLLSYSIVPFTKTHLLIKLEQSTRVALPEALQSANRSTALSTHFSRSQDENHDNS